MQAFSWKKEPIHLLCSLAITVLLLFCVFRELAPNDFFELLKQVDRSLVLSYAGLSLIALVLRALRYGVLLRSIESVSCPNLTKLLTVTAVRNTLVDFFPARLGELSYVYILNRYGVSVLSGFSSFAVCLVLDLVLLFAVFLVIALDNVYLVLAGGCFLWLAYVILQRFEFICLGAKTFCERQAKQHSGNGEQSRYVKLTRWLANCFEKVSRDVRVLAIGLTVHLITQVFGYSLGLLGIAVFWLNVRGSSREVSSSA